MIDSCRDHLAHLSADYVYETKDKVKITETKAGGAGVVDFATKSAAIVLKAHNQPPLVWALKKRRCADGAFLTFDDDAVTLHLVELKSKLTRSEWAKAVEQLEGMFLSALAVARLLHISHFDKVICYLAFAVEAMDPKDATEVVLSKTLVGDTKRLGSNSAWLSEKVPFPFDTVASLVKLKRDSSGNAMHVLN